MDLIESDPEYHMLLQLYPHQGFDPADSRSWMGRRSGGTICDGDLRLVHRYYRSRLYEEEKSVPLPPTIRDFVRRFPFYFARTLRAIQQAGSYDGDWSEFGGECPYFGDDDRTFGFFDTYLTSWDRYYDANPSAPPPVDCRVNWVFALAGICAFSKTDPQRAREAIERDRANEAEWWLELSCSPNLYMHLVSYHPRINLQEVFGLTYPDTAIGEETGPKTKANKTAAAFINARRTRTTLYDDLVI